MTLSDNVVGAIEKKVLKTPAMYRYNEVTTKTFPATAGQRSWKHEYIFTKEPLMRLIVALCRNNAFVGTNNTNPYHYQKFDLSEITVYRKTCSELTFIRILLELSYGCLKNKVYS